MKSIEQNRATSPRYQYNIWARLTMPNTIRLGLQSVYRLHSKSSRNVPTMSEIRTRRCSLQKNPRSWRVLTNEIVVSKCHFQVGQMPLIVYFRLSTIDRRTLSYSLQNGWESFHAAALFLSCQIISVAFSSTNQHTIRWWFQINNLLFPWSTVLSSHVPAVKRAATFPRTKWPRNEPIYTWTIEV